MSNNYDGVTYIEEYLMDYMNVNLSVKELNEYSKDIYLMLRKNGCRSYDIVNGIYDEKIRVLYNRIKMKSKSVANKNVPKKIKYNKRKRNMQKALLVLLIIVCLTGVGYGMVTAVDKYNDYQARQTFHETYDYSFPYIYTSLADGYKTSVNSVLEYYNDTESLNNENYSHLGFYQAYSHVQQDKLAVMDDMLSSVAYNASMDNKYSDVFDKLNQYDSYLGFAMDRLEDMGCEEIKEEKYVKALEAYEKQKNARPKEITYDALDKDVKEVINEIMSMYREYSDDLEVECGYFIDSSSISKGKN